MRKNRIWWEGIRAGMSAIILAGTIMSCIGQPVRAEESAGTGGLTMTQEASWSDWESRRAAVTMTVGGTEAVGKTMVMYLSEYFLFL